MGTTIYGQSRLESNGNEGVFHIPETARLEYLMQFNVISKTIIDFKDSCLTLIIIFNIIHLFAQLNGLKHWYIILIFQFNFCT